MEFNSFESDCGPLYPIMFIDTDTFDIPAPVGLTLAEVLFEQMDERGYKVIVLEELEPASSIMSDIEIVKACETTWRRSVTTRACTCASCRWLEGQRSGLGVLSLANGDRYEGHWLVDQKEGPGRFFYFSTRTKSTRASGRPASPSAAPSRTSRGAGVCGRGTRPAANG